MILASPPKSTVVHLSEVVLQRADQDESDQPAEKDDHHERVEDREPVDLVLEEGGIEVVVEPLVEGLRGLDPLNLPDKVNTFRRGGGVCVIIRPYR